MANCFVLRDIGYQDAKLFYNGTTQQDIESSGALGIDGP